MKPIKIAVVSDIHLGHKKNTATEIIRNLKNAFPNDATTAELDIIFLAGDIFDDLLSLNDEEVIEIDFWIAYMLNICARHKIKLRVLEGTPSHDWCQSNRFVSINEFAEINCDLKYIKDLSIEYFEDFDCNVLYIPDEWEDNTDKTFNQVKELLKAKGLRSVDIGIMHGAFNFQLPSYVKTQKHNEEEYLKIVKENIFIGHIHTHTQYKRIVAQGSFDRLAHGEEEPKGHVRANILGNGERYVTFIENVNAKKFITVHCIYDESLTDVLNKINNTVNQLPDGSYVRIEAMIDNPIITNMELLIRQYPLFTWSKIVREVDDLEEEQSVIDETIYTPIMITRDNIKDLLINRLIANGTSKDILDVSNIILEECM